MPSPLTTILANRGKVTLYFELQNDLISCVSPRLLLAELVGGEGEYREAPALILLVDRLHALVLRRETALAGGVDNQEHFPFVPGEINRLVLDVADLEVEHRGWFLRGLAGRNGPADAE